MSIEKIDPKLCDGCGICVDACALDVIRMDEKSKKAVIQYPEECMTCYICKTDCPKEAIYISPVRVLPLFVAWG